MQTYKCLLAPAPSIAQDREDPALCEGVIDGIRLPDFAGHVIGTGIATWSGEDAFGPSSRTSPSLSGQGAIRFDSLHHQCERASISSSRILA